MFCFNKKINTDYLKLSQIAYGGEFYYLLRKYQLKELDISNSKFKKINDELLKKIGNTSFYSYKNESSGFVAVLFENIKNKELVIAYRGTERIGLGENYNNLGALTKDVQTDMNLVFSNVDEQFTDAYEFYKIVKQQNPKVKITILGQSLGGALAQLTAAKIYNETKQKIKTFSYNAPGCYHLLKLIGCDVNLNYSFITNYAVMNDWCGMFGKKIGTTYLLPPIPLKKNETASPVEIIEGVLLASHEGIFAYQGNVIKKPKNFNQAEGLSLWYYDLNNPIKDFETPSAFINTLVGAKNIPQMPAIGKAIQDKFEDFIEGQSEKIQEISSQIQTISGEFFEEQKERLEDVFNNNTLGQIMKFLDVTFSQITPDSLQNALKMLKDMKINKTYPDFYNSFSEYIQE